MGSLSTNTLVEYTKLHIFFLEHLGWPSGSEAGAEILT